MDKAQEEVKEALSNLVFPEGVQEPEVSRLSMNAFPIMSLSISNNEQTLAELTKTLEEDVIPQIEGIDGISTTQISGQQLEEAQVKFNVDKMKENGLNEETVKNIIKGSDISFPLGLYTFDDTEKSVVVDGNFTKIEDLKTLKIPVIPSGAGTQGQQGAPANQQAGDLQSQAPMAIPTIELQDIATIEIVGKAESFSRTNGETSIGVQIVKAADANTVDVVNDVKDNLKELESKIDGLKVTPIFDQGKPIEESVQTMPITSLFQVKL